MQNFLTKLSHVYKNIKEQSYTLLSNYKLPFSPPPAYLKRHIGKDFLVLCPGPLLKKHEPQIKTFIKDENPIIIGCNHSILLIEPHYQVFCNKRRLNQILNSFPPGITLILNSKINTQKIKKQIHKNIRIEPLYYTGEKSTHLVINEKTGLIDATGHTALFVLCTAYLMGADKIFIAGMDGFKDYFEKNTCRHFDSFSYNNLDDHSPEVKSKVKYWDEITTLYLKQFWQFCREKNIEVEFLTPSVYSPISRFE